MTVPADQIITFASGLPGFPEARRFALIDDHLEPPFYCLQCMDNPSLAFVVTDPAALVPDYRPKNGANTLKELQASSLEDLQSPGDSDHPLWTAPGDDRQSDEPAPD